MKNESIVTGSQHWHPSLYLLYDEWSINVWK